MITKEFGQRLKEFRQETGLSQEKFALKISMDRTYYWKTSKKLQMVLEYR